MIKTDGIWFKDEHGRIVMLRGVNLGGNSKYPTRPNGQTHQKDGFFNHREVSFVGRPFPLEEADEHFGRLAKWGLTFIRFLVTWEAIEHAGAGIYDTEYLDYVVAIVQKAHEHGLVVYIDPHQDVWSRFTGGDGAPGWTLEAVGFDLHNFQETHAAIVHQTLGDPFPRMIWATNYNRLATATMFSLFWAGNHFAPKTLIEGVPAQEYLQSHFLNAIQQLVIRLKDSPCVMGYDTMNEPSAGYIGFSNLNQAEYKLKNGITPTPYQAMLLGSGFAQTVDEWGIGITGNRKIGELPLSPHGKLAWQAGKTCVWRENGVWDIDAAGNPHLLRPTHFSRIEDRPVDFAHDCLRPFVHRYAQMVRDISPNAVIFFEGDALGDDYAPRLGDLDNVVFAPHWYDGLTLLTKRYIPFLAFDTHTLKPVVGVEQVKQSFLKQIRIYKESAQDRVGQIPTIIGEIGIPFDMNGAVSYRNGDYSAQEHAMDASIKAVENNLMAFNLWNYTADNTHERGDGWNGEDLSIFSRDQQTNPRDINSGGRALKAVIRPYAYAVMGEPIRTKYDYESGEFEFVYRHQVSSHQPTEFYIPQYQYPQGYRVEVSDGHFEIDTANQRLVYWHSDRDMPHFIKVSPSMPRPEPVRNTFGRIVALALIGIVVWNLVFRRKK